MKFAFLLAALLFAGGAAAPGPRVTHAATLILGFTDGTCSGTAIAKSVVLTAEHCIVHGPLIKINGKPAEVVGEPVLDGNDHAIIRVNVQFKRWARIGGPMRQAEKVHFWGNPGGLSDQFRRGYITGFQDDWVLFDCMGWKGDSGAALFNEAGLIVGVVSVLHVQDSFQLMGAKQFRFTAEQWRAAGA